MYALSITKFYKRLFILKISCAAFHCLKFMFVFLAKEYWQKSASKMLVKLTLHLNKKLF